MNEWNVLESLHTLLPVTDDIRAQLLPLCRAAADTLLPRLKDNADPNDPRLAQAAAGIAYYHYMLRKSAEDADMTYFKAGDVTVHRTGTPIERRACQVRDEMLLPALPLLRDEQFVFRSM